MWFSRFDWWIAKMEKIRNREHKNKPKFNRKLKIRCSKNCIISRDRTTTKNWTNETRSLLQKQCWKNTLIFKAVRRTQKMDKLSK